MEVALVLLREQGERRRFPLSQDVVTIGRGEGCDLRIPLGEVSRKHCSLVKSDESLLIQDIGSSNGTFVNGKRVREAPLQPGDLIRVGPVSFFVQIDGQPAEDELDTFTPGGTTPDTPAAEPSTPPEGLGPDESPSPQPASKGGDANEREMLELFEEDDDWP